MFVLLVLYAHFNKCASCFSLTNDSMTTYSKTSSSLICTAVVDVHFLFTLSETPKKRISISSKQHALKEGHLSAIGQHQTCRPSTSKSSVPALRYAIISYHNAATTYVALKSTVNCCIALSVLSSNFPFL